MPFSPAGSSPIRASSRARYVVARTLPTVPDSRPIMESSASAWTWRVRSSAESASSVLLAGTGAMVAGVHATANAATSVHANAAHRPLSTARISNSTRKAENLDVVGLTSRVSGVARAHLRVRGVEHVRPMAGGPHPSRDGRTRTRLIP